MKTTKLFPKNLLRVIDAHGDKELFLKALRGEMPDKEGAYSFYRKYKNPPYLPLSIEVLPPWMNAAKKGRPAVSVCHYFEQNGDLMRDPEIVFSASTEEEWVAYECQQDPVGKYTIGVDVEARLIYPKIIASITALANMWARNLIEQGWHEAKVVPFPEEKTPLEKAFEILDNL